MTIFIIVLVIAALVAIITYNLNKEERDTRQQVIVNMWRDKFKTLNCYIEVDNSMDDFGFMGFDVEVYDIDTGELLATNFVKNMQEAITYLGEVYRTLKAERV